MPKIPPPDFPQFLSSAERMESGIRCAGAFRLTDIQPTTVGWLWPGRIPLGYVTLLVGDPGAGKSLVALDIAARVSTGRPWPDQCSPLAPRDDHTPSSVLILTVEDHFASTVCPRLQSLGADCSRILGMSHVPGDGVLNMPRPAAINRDVDRLEILLREVADCRLIILDPITAFFGDSSSRSTGNIWKTLAALSVLAASANLAVLAISHIRKKEGAAIHGAMGSLAYIAAARAAWTISTDRADSSRRLFLPLKNNLAESAGGLAFTIQSAAGGGPLIRWLPETIDARPRAAASSCRWPGRPNDDRQFAIDWLRRELTHRQSPVQQIRKAAEAHGITWGTLRRAFRELGAQAVFKRQDRHIRWDWKLPVIESQNPVGEL